MDGETYFRWYVGRTEPRREHLAAAGLTRHRIKSYFPEFFTSRRCGHRRRNVLEPMLPGYVFLYLPWLREPWEIIRGINGILAHRPFLSADGHPKAIADQVVKAVRDVEALYRRWDEEEQLQFAGRQFRIGQSVEVEFTDHFGTVSSFRAIVENIAKLDRQGRIRVTAEWLGGLTSMDVPATKIKAA